MNHGRNKKMSIRFTEEEYTSIRRMCYELYVPLSTYVHDLLLKQVLKHQKNKEKKDE